MMLSTVLSNTPPGPVIPDAPEVISASAIGVSSFEFAYSEALGATDYYFDVSTSPSFDSFVSGYQNRLTNQQNDFRDTVTGLTGNTEYYIRMRAANSAGTSPNSAAFFVLTLPAAPVAIAATSVQNTSFTANWQPVGGSFTYRLDVSTDNAFGSFVSGYQNLAVNGESVSVTGLVAGTTYYYRVRAINSSGTSANSNVIDTATLAAIPSAPTGLAALNIGQNSFTANWSAISGATSYRLDVSTNISFTSLVLNNVEVTNTSRVVLGLSSGTQYFYRVRAVNSSGTSANSNVISLTTQASIPTSPNALTASGVQDTSFQANWSTVSNATSYRLDVSLFSSFSSFVSGYNNFVVGSTSELVSGLAQNTAYFYRVRAVNSAGTSFNSNVISVTTTNIGDPF